MYPSQLSMYTFIGLVAALVLCILVVIVKIADARDRRK